MATDDGDFRPTCPSNSLLPTPDSPYLATMYARELPIFPLPLVLFPGTPQLLHIFEPRYRQMLADCETGDRTFGISFVEPTPDADLAPEPGDVGCMAHVRAVRYLPDGRANIMTVGGHRFVLESYVETDRLYRLAQVTPFDDEAVAHDAADALSAALRREYARLAEAIAAVNDQIVPPVELPDDPRQLSFRVAAALEVSGEVKQQLLELRSTETRLQLLQDILQQLFANVEQRVRLHLHAKGNGKGGSKVTLDQ